MKICIIWYTMTGKVPNLWLKHDIWSTDTFVTENVKRVVFQFDDLISHSQKLNQYSVTANGR